MRWRESQGVLGSLHPCSQPGPGPPCRAARCRPRAAMPQPCSQPSPGGGWCRRDAWFCESICGIRTAVINPTCNPGVWSKEPFFWGGGVFSRAPCGIVTGVPHPLICHQPHSDTLQRPSWQLTQLRDPSAGFRMSPSQPVTAPGLTLLQSRGVGVPHNHRHSQPVSLSQPALLPRPDFPCTPSCPQAPSTLAPLSVTCSLGGDALGQGWLHAGAGAGPRCWGNPPLHCQHNEHPWSFHPALQPHVSLSASSLAPPKMLPRQKLPLLSHGMWEPRGRELGEPAVPSRRGRLSPAGRDFCLHQKHGSLGQGPGLSQAKWIRGEREGKRVGAGYCKWDGERMGSKDEPQPSPVWGALGSQEKPVSIVLLPQSPQLSSSQESANHAGFISSNLRDAIKEGGEELDVGGRALPKQLPLRVPPSTGLSPEAKSIGLSRDPPQNRPHLCLMERGSPAPLEKPGSAGCC